ncbi:glycosyltransferase 87 family protein [Candidatus Pelagibacter sp.]|uniref:glycosyltransferase 87 family protein n=1 Tax=Candidatus Pelagibacter sp. TaxID=2024849 RepID=UPI003F830BB9
MKIKKEEYNVILFVILASILIFAYKPIVLESIHNNSLDFQWSPSKLVADGVNHYQYMLDGKREKIIGSQFGEYLHGTYILFYPLTFLSWNNAKIAWLIINLLLTLVIPYLICKKFKIEASKMILIIFFFATCNVTKVNLIIGQYSLFILFFFCLPFLFKSKLALILSGISYFKYSLSYVLLLNFLATKNIKKIIYPLFPVIVGLVIYCILTKTNVFFTFFEPFQLAVKNQLTNNQGQIAMPKNIFIFSIFEKISILNLKYKSFYLLLLSVIVNFLIIIKIQIIKDELLKLSCLCISSLVFFPHYPHNFIFVLPLLIHSIKTFNLLQSKINFLIAIYFLNFFRLIEIYIPKLFENISIKIEFYINYINIMLLLIVLINNIWKINYKKLI